jgi:hypothetical protein
VVKVIFVPGVTTIVFGGEGVAADRDRGVAEGDGHARHCAKCGFLDQR